jgi:Tol biopolymer transport system component
MRFPMKRLPFVPLALVGLLCVLAASGATTSTAPTRSPTLLFERGPYCEKSPYTRDLYSIAADGSRLQRLTRDGASFWGAWSPDGSRIVFARQVMGDCITDQEYDIFVIRADGSHVRRLTRDGDDVGAAFSPDGAKLVFTQGSSIVVSDANAKHRRIVAHGCGPAWSPDGRRILYHSCEGNGISVVDLTTGRIRHVAGGAGDYIETGVWSPNGTRIVFARKLQQSGRKRYELWLMRPDGSAKTPLTNEAAGKSDDEQPVWSPDGRQIAFSRSSDHGSELILLTINGRSERTLLQRAEGVDGPAWSPDGSLIAFGRTLAGRSSLWIVHPDGSGLHRLSSSRLPDAAPVWQP